MRTIHTKSLGICFFIFCHQTYGQEWKTYNETANKFREQKKYDSAIAYYSRARENLRSPSDSLEIKASVKIDMTLADLYYSMGQYKMTESICLELKNKIEKSYGKWNADYAWNANLLGQLYYNTNPNNAEPYFLDAKEIREKLSGKKDSMYALSCNNLGNLYYKLGQYKKAEPLYLEAKEIREKVLPRLHSDYAQSCNNLGNLYRVMGEYQKAEPFVTEAREIRGLVLGKQNPTYAISCINLANLCRDMGQYEKAEALYIEGKNIREKMVPVKQHALYAASCNILADLYYLMGDYQKAEPLYLEAKEIRGSGQGKSSSDYAQTCNNLADLYRDKGEYEKAEPLALEARSIWEKVLGKESSSYATNCDNLGLLYFKMHQYDKARLYFLESKPIWLKIAGKDHPSYTSNMIYLAKLYWSLKDLKKANELYTKAFYAQYDQINRFFQFTNENEKELYLKNINGSGDEYQSFYYKELSHTNAGEAFNISLLRRNLILTATQQWRQIIFNSGDTTLRNKFNDWKNLKQQLADIHLKNIPDTAETELLEDRSNTLEKELTRQSFAFKKIKERENIKWAAIQAALKPNEAAIEFTSFRFDNGDQYTDSVLYVALLLRKDIPVPKLIFLFNEKQLTNLLSFTGNKINSDGVKELYSSRGVIVGNDTSIASSKSIYGLVWKPLEKELKGVKTIYFAPSGLLHRIAFAALPVNKTEVLSDRYKLVQLATTASVTDPASTFITSSDKLQLYGGIKYDADPTELKKNIRLYAANSLRERTRSVTDDITRGGSFNYLPGTQAEIAGIEKQAKKTKNYVSVLSGAKATEESFKILNDKASPSIIHIATHGFFFPDPTDTKGDLLRKFEINGKAFKQSDNPLFRSGLLFAGANNAWEGKSVEGIEDGILTAYEVSNMYLPETKLVVLSACETGLGDIQGSEGVYGMQRAFKMAGVKNLVMSLWKVPDESTVEFMQEFYKHLLNKELIIDAFYKTQSHMKNKYRNKPYNWAAWVLIR